MPTFSIIVPVYNAEKTLLKCLDSICGQSYPDFEVLMIENGSMDASRTLCGEYAAADARFMLVTCETNCGPSGARNIGLAQAKGEYIAFVDSDDFVEADYLETLRQGFAQADVVFFGYHQILADGTFLGDHIPNIPEGAGYYETLLALAQQDVYGYTWIKALRRDVIGQHRFTEKLNLLEDEVFACEVLTARCRLAVLPKPLYHYVTGNARSLIGRTHTDYCRKVDVAYGAWEKLMQEYEKKDEALTSMANAHVNRCMYYGFERELDAKVFFEHLAQSTFFARSTVESEFAKCVQSRNYRKLACMRACYRIKNKVAKLLKSEANNVRKEKSSDSAALAENGRHK